MDLDPKTSIFPTKKWTCNLKICGNLEMLTKRSARVSPEILSEDWDLWHLIHGTLGCWPPNMMGYEPIKIRIASAKTRIAATKTQKYRICKPTKRIENESTNKGCTLEIVEGKLLEVAKLEGFPSWDFQNDGHQKSYDSRSQRDKWWSISKQLSCTFPCRTSYPLELDWRTLLWRCSQLNVWEPLLTMKVWVPALTFSQIPPKSAGLGRLCPWILTLRDWDADVVDTLANLACSQAHCELEGQSLPCGTKINPLGSPPNWMVNESTRNSQSRDPCQSLYMFFPKHDLVQPRFEPKLLQLKSGLEPSAAVHSLSVDDSLQPSCPDLTEKLWVFADVGVLVLVNVVPPMPQFHNQFGIRDDSLEIHSFSW